MHSVLFVAPTINEVIIRHIWVGTLEAWNELKRMLKVSEAEREDDDDDDDDISGLVMRGCYTEQWNAVGDALFGPVDRFSEPPIFAKEGLTTALEGIAYNNNNHSSESDAKAVIRFDFLVRFLTYALVAEVAFLEGTGESPKDQGQTSEGQEESPKDQDACISEFIQKTIRNNTLGETPFKFPEMLRDAGELVGLYDRVLLNEVMPKFSKEGFNGDTVRQVFIQIRDFIANPEPLRNVQVSGSNEENTE